MTGEPPGAKQQVTPGRRAGPGISALLWVAGQHPHYSLLASADEEIITSAMTPPKHQAGFVPPFENMPRGEYLVI